MAVKTFTGTGTSDTWSNAARWTGGTKPVDGDTFVIAAGSTCTVNEQTAWMGAGGAGGYSATLVGTLTGSLVVDVTAGGQLRLRGAIGGNGTTGATTDDTGQLRITNGLPGTAAVIFDTDTGAGTGNIYPIIMGTGTSATQSSRFICDAGTSATITPAQRWWAIDVQGTGSVYFDQVNANAGGCQHYLRGAKFTGNLTNGAAATNSALTVLGTAFRVVPYGSATVRQLYWVENCQFAECGAWRVTSSATTPRAIDQLVWRHNYVATNTYATEDINLGAVLGFPALTTGTRELSGFVFKHLASGSLAAHKDWTLGTPTEYLIVPDVTTTTFLCASTRDSATIAAGRMHFFVRNTVANREWYYDGHFGPSVYYVSGGSSGAKVDAFGPIAASGVTIDPLLDQGGINCGLWRAPTSDLMGSTAAAKVRLKGWMIPKNGDGTAPGSWFNAKFTVEASNCTAFSTGTNDGGVLVGENTSATSVDVHDCLILSDTNNLAIAVVQHAGTADGPNVIKGTYNVFRKRATSLFTYAMTVPGYATQTTDADALDVATGTGDANDDAITLVNEAWNLDTFGVEHTITATGDRAADAESTYAELAKFAGPSHQSWARVENIFPSARAAFKPTAAPTLGMTRLYSGGSGLGLTGGASNAYAGAVEPDAPVGGGLTAGSLTLSGVTSSSVDVLVGVPTGGTAPYSAQVQRGAGASPGSWANVGSAMAGGFGSLTDSGLTASTTYSYRVQYTDAVPTTVTGSAQTTTTSAAGAVGPAETLTTWDRGVPWDVKATLSQRVIGQVFTVPTGTPTLTRISFYLRAMGGTQPRYRLFVFAWGAGGATGAALHESAWLTTPTDRVSHTRVDYTLPSGLLLTAGAQYVWFLSPVDSSVQRGTVGDALVLLGAVRPTLDPYTGGTAVTKLAPTPTEGTRNGIDWSDLTDPNSRRAWGRLSVDLAFEMAFA
jgi:hypothetical protein